MSLIDYVTEQRRVPLTFKLPDPPSKVILAEVSVASGVPIDDLRGRKRWRSVAWPRQEAMYRMRAETNLSYPQIGRLLGGRDHSTIVTGVKRHAARLGLPLPR
jgi:chromosomal replication initiation ATPase DnaA